MLNSVDVTFHGNLHKDIYVVDLNVTSSDPITKYAHDVKWKKEECNLVEKRAHPRFDGR